MTSGQFAGKRKVLNIFPVLIPVFAPHQCKLTNWQPRSTTPLCCASADLPFAQSRFCGAEGLNNVITLSTFRNAEFLQAYGVAIADGPLKGLAARAVVVIDESDNVIFSQLVDEITTEPDYEAALAVLKSISLYALMVLHHQHICAYSSFFFWLKPYSRNLFSVLCNVKCRDVLPVCACWDNCDKAGLIPKR